MNHFVVHRATNSIERIVTSSPPQTLINEILRKELEKDC